MNGMEFFIDPSRCIGCQACVQACGECDTHRGKPMIHLEYVDRGAGVQTAPVVCMHCEDPACASVCPADAIKKTPDGVVQTSMRARCVGCSNCVLACPFGVPRYSSGIDQMMKCDMCYDRTSAGRKPMCATVCPSGALFYGPRADIERLRREKPLNAFRFGEQLVLTKVNIMAAPEEREIEFDILRFMPEAGDGTSGGQPDVASLSVWEAPL